MFATLGDAEAHNRIREAKPDAVHCKLLANDCNACMTCPLPENPYGPLPEGSKEPTPKALAARALLDHYETVSEALESFSDLEIGLLDNQRLLQMTPEEVTAIRIVQQQEKFSMARMQGEIIAGVLAQMMLGSPKNENG